MRSNADLLTPELLDGLRDLDWAARMIARGLGVGIHRSAFSGMGEEFDRHRPYQQGDDLRHLDWRLLARSDRLHVRRYREATNLRALLVLDATPSMDFASPGGVTKLAYARIVAAALGHILVRAGDLPGLAVLDRPGGVLAAPPRPGREGWNRFLHALSAVEPGEPASLASFLDRAGEGLPPGSRVVVLSDFLEDDGGAGSIRAATRLRTRGDEVSAVRILTPDELGTGTGGDALYLDPEDPTRRVPADPGRDPGYRTRLRAYYDAVAGGLREGGVEWREVSTADPLLPFFREWVRGGRGGRSPV